MKDFWQNKIKIKKNVDKKSMEERKEKKSDQEWPNYVYEGKNVTCDGDYSIEMGAEKEFSTEKKEQDENVEETLKKETGEISCKENCKDKIAIEKMYFIRSMNFKMTRKKV